jgi:hypothetical protein
MRRAGFLRLRLLLLIGLYACQPQQDWNTLTIARSTQNPDLLSYSLQFPSDWVGRSDQDHVILTSEEKLLTQVPRQLEAGQIVAEISADLHLRPEEMVDAYASRLQGQVDFTDTVSFEVNKQPAARKLGAFAESGDEVLVIAVDMGENMRGLLAARMAEGEMNKWDDILFKVAESLRVEE